MSFRCLWAAKFAFLKCPFLLRFWTPYGSCPPWGFKAQALCRFKLLLLDGEDGEWGVTGSPRQRGKCRSIEYSQGQSPGVALPESRAGPDLFSICSLRKEPWLLRLSEGAGLPSLRPLILFPQQRCVFRKDRNVRSTSRAKQGWSIWRQSQPKRGTPSQRTLSRHVWPSSCSSVSPSGEERGMEPKLI